MSSVFSGNLNLVSDDVFCSPNHGMEEDFPDIFEQSDKDDISFGITSDNFRDCDSSMNPTISIYFGGSKSDSNQLRSCKEDVIDSE